MLADRNERPDLANQFALGLARAGDSEKTSVGLFARPIPIDLLLRLHFLVGVLVEVLSN
jgi:hypothetical protein